MILYGNLLMMCFLVPLYSIPHSGKCFWKALKALYLVDFLKMVKYCSP